ncbi:DUF2071 domain-containing protein [Aquimarina sp. TRL1]|uniref:YqjF family protein n=1 Tax=Aquimarina sp. (strain TRL1) TaxID=2736252 RepID=UPI00158ED8C3|nr:DUF2071 domain-containing protein [Aquimarina sp. TRL1]QKX06794.1 DUF2071 domain-containing protein [Aquimarina sp. TRL1]
MTLKNILDTTAHRPWELPAESWKFYQEWNEVVFLHYPVTLTELKKHVPKELEIDLFDGTPWVSIVAFTMEKIRPKNVPAFSPISDFDEINIRTYVRSGNKTGVYFLSIEAGKKLSCAIARRISELPYRFSKIERTDQKYQAQNPKFNDLLNIEFTIGKKLRKKTRLDIWLTERYALFQDSEQAINEFDIHHLEWCIHELTLEKLEIKYPRFEKLINNTPAKIHYSKGVKVIAWNKKKKQDIKNK